MNGAASMKNFANKVYKNFAGDLGKLLLWTGTIGWILSSLGQLAAIGMNKKLPKEQKKFLIPQEMADAGINIASFFILTRSVTRLGERMVESGKLATPKIRAFITKHNLEAKAGTKELNLSKLPQIKDELGKDFDKETSKAYFRFADGVSFISSTIGSIISCNVVTPILRNKFASNRQKNSISKDNIRQEATFPTSPVLPAQNKFNNDNKKPKIYTPSVMPSGSMKI